MSSPLALSPRERGLRCAILRGHEHRWRLCWTPAWVFDDNASSVDTNSNAPVIPLGDGSSERNRERRVFVLS